MQAKMTFRTFSLAAALALTLGLGGYASAHSAISSGTMQQATEAATATPIDPDQPVALTLGQAATSPLDKDNVPHRIFTFKGKANELVNLTVKVTSGNMAYDVTLSSQNGDELGKESGGFIVASMLTVKLPQDGNYTFRIDADDPGSGDFAPGNISVMVADAAASSATATPTASG